MQTKTITTISELGTIAREILGTIEKSDTARIITLKGDLGAGKTAFTKELSKVLGVREEITSPTFVVMKLYEIHAHSFFKTLVHIDAYRIESDDEMRVLGFNEMISDPSRLVCIEWPELIENLIPSEAFHVSLSINLDETRTITYGN